MIERVWIHLGHRPWRSREELESEVARLDAELHNTQAKLLRVLVAAEQRARGRPRAPAGTVPSKRHARRLRKKKTDLRDILLSMADLMRIDGGEFRITGWPDDKEK